MNVTGKKWWYRMATTLGAAMVLAGMVCAGLFFVGIPDEVAASSSTTTTTGGPENDTLYLTIPEIGLEDVEVHDSDSEERLRESAIHLPGTGFPWQEGANTYIAGHRLGYPGTGSFLVFFRLNELERGDEILLEDGTGRRYVYLVAETLVVGPGEVEVTEPVPGKSVVSLQTCTLPDFSERLVVRGELVEQ